MELDDLRKGWKERTTEHTKLHQKNMEQLETMLRQNAGGVLAVVKKKYGSLISYFFIVSACTLVLVGFFPFLMGQDAPVYAGPTTLDRALNMVVVLLIGLSGGFFYWIRYQAAETAVGGKELRQALQGS